MLILPTTNLGEEDQDYAVACAIRVDAPGVVHLFGRQTNDNRRLDGDIDTGNSEYAIVGGETLTVLNDVFVPWDRVFMCGEYKFAQEYVSTFAAYHRQNYGGCKAVSYTHLDVYKRQGQDNRARVNIKYLAFRL